MNFEHLITKSQLRKHIEFWLDEDLPTLDVAGALVGQKQATTARLICKQETEFFQLPKTERRFIRLMGPAPSPQCVLAGRPFFNGIMSHFDCVTDWTESAKDGQCIDDVPTVLATISGPVQSLLLAERTALNVVSRCSGIATLTKRIINKIHQNKPDWTGRLAATRKTTPGFRLPEKYAVVVGGGDPHRYSLQTMIMLKDNHVDAMAGDIEQAVSQTRQLAGNYQMIEVEARTEQDALLATRAGAHIVMLDNFSAQAAKEASAAVKALNPSTLVEVSGGITEDNILQYCHQHVDSISMSKLTQGYDTIDFSMKLNPQ